MLQKNEHKSLCWLSVEDSPEDYEVFERTVKKAELPVNLIHCLDFEATLACLENFDDNECGERKEKPDLIFLDLNLPGADGFHVLKKLRDNKNYASIPVIILSTSSNPTDVSKAYALGANCYIAKPQDLQSYKSMVEALKTFWIGHVMAPQTVKREFHEF